MAPGALIKALEMVANWLCHSRLKLNPLKTEVLCLDWGALDSWISLMTLNRVPLIPAARSLGMILDASLTMEAQVNNGSPG